MGDYLSSIDSKFIFIIVVFLFIIRFISVFFIENYQVLVARKFQSYLSTESLEKVLFHSMSEIEKKEIGWFISMSGDESSRASEILNSSLKIFNAFVLFILYLCMIIYFDFKIVITLFLLFVISFFIVRIVMKKSFNLGQISLVEGRYASSIFIDSLNSIKTIKSFGIETFASSKYRTSVYNYQMTNYKLFSLSLINRIFPIIILFILFILYILFDYYGSNLLLTAYLITVFFILMRFLLNLGELLQTISKVIGELKFTNNIIDFITAQSKDTNFTKEISNIKNIKFDNVSFSYDKKTNIFNALNLEFNIHNSYAIVGQTGTGKSTLIDLMMDFQIPISGSVLMNNINTTKIDIKSLKERIIYISQESIIFNDTIRNNLVLDKQYTDEEVFESLKLVNLDSMVKNLEEGLDYLLYYKGTNISGGQKQRLNIARAILRKPDVLILDESINALDFETRISVVTKLLAEYKNKIIIFVTHDKDILNLVDNIISLDSIKKHK
jgi:ABC-type bacteriocin/lantibiotic exporter with double-glycine peptidase domain